MDINQVIQVETDRLLQEKLPGMVAAKIEKMLDGLLEDIFRSYGDTGKAIKGKIEQALDINLQEFGLADYNAMVSKAISERLAHLVNEQAIQPIMSLVDDAVKFVERKDIKLSVIHAMFIQESMENEYADEPEGEISFLVEEDMKYGWYRVSCDTEKNKTARECEIEFLISKESGRIFSFSTNKYNSKKGQITPSKMTGLSRLEHKIFRLYSAQVKIEVDETEFENFWSKYD